MLNADIERQRTRTHGTSVKRYEEDGELLQSNNRVQNNIKTQCLCAVPLGTINTLHTHARCEHRESWNRRERRRDKEEHITHRSAYAKC